MISFIIPYFIYSILISKPKKIYAADTSLSLSLPWLFHLNDQVAGSNKKEKRKKSHSMLYMLFSTAFPSLVLWHVDDNYSWKALSSLVHFDSKEIEFNHTFKIIMGYVLFFFFFQWMSVCCFWTLVLNLIYEKCNKIFIWRQ